MLQALPGGFTVPATDFIEVHDVQPTTARGRRSEKVNWNSGNSRSDARPGSRRGSREWQSSSVSGCVNAQIYGRGPEATLNAAVAPRRKGMS